MTPKAEKILAGLAKRKASLAELELAQGIQQASKAGALGREIARALEISPQSVSRLGALLDPAWEEDLPALEYRSSTLMDWRALSEPVRNAARAAYKMRKKPFSLNDLRRLRHADCRDPDQVYDICENLVIPRSERSIRRKEGRPVRASVEVPSLVDDTLIARLQAAMSKPYAPPPAASRASLVTEEGRYVAASAARSQAVPVSVQIPKIDVSISVALRLLVALGGDPKTPELLLEAELVRRLEDAGGHLVDKHSSGRLAAIEDRVEGRLADMKKRGRPKSVGSRPVPEKA